MIWRFAIAAGVLMLLTQSCGPRVRLANPSYPAKASWDELPADERARLKAQRGTGEEPPYPVGGMQAIMDRVDYSRLARRTEVQGVVTVVATINPHGGVESASVDTPVHPELDRAAIAAVRATDFRPAMKDGQPVTARVAIQFHFQLTDGWWSGLFGS